MDIDLFKKKLSYRIKKWIFNNFKNYRNIEAELYEHKNLRCSMVCWHMSRIVVRS